MRIRLSYNVHSARTTSVDWHYAARPFDIQRDSFRRECFMHRKTFRVIIVIVLTLVSVTACERGEKDEDEKATPTPSASANSAQQQMALPGGKAATYNFDSASPGSLPSDFVSARTGGGDVGTWAILADSTAPS